MKTKAIVVVSQSPAGSQLVSDRDMCEYVVDYNLECRNPPQGLSSFPTFAVLFGGGALFHMSQSPAGSQLVSDWNDGKTWTVQQNLVAIPRRVSARFRQGEPE